MTGSRVGDHVVVSGPYGAFTLPLQSSASWLFLAAGSGVAPFRAMAEPAVEVGTVRRIQLLLSARSEDDVVDREYFATLARRCSLFSFLTALTAGGPRIPELLPHLFTDLSSTEVFTAGPRAFVDACVDAAAALGALPSHIHAEPF